MYGQLSEDELKTSFTIPFGPSRKSYGEKAGNLIETDENLHRNGRQKFRTFTVKNGSVPK